MYLEVGGPNGYSGTVDEVAIYPTALSAAQIANHFAASGYTRPGVPGSVVATTGSNSVSVSWTAPTATVPAGELAVRAAFPTGTPPGLNPITLPPLKPTAVFASPCGAPLPP